MKKAIILTTFTMLFILAGCNQQPSNNNQQNDEIAEIKQQLTQLQDENQNLKKQMDSSDNQSDKEIEDLKSKIEEITNKNNDLQQKANELQNQVDIYKNQKQATTNNSNNTTIEENNSYCTDQPTPTEIGSDIYPIAEKYKHLQFLGQIFTASNCGDERLNKIFGVRNREYSMGSSISLKNNPSEQLINDLKSIGFKCGDELEDKSCKSWELWEKVKIKDLLKLEPYYNDFERDDCRNCG